EAGVRAQRETYRLDTGLTASPSGLVTFDVDGRIATANPTAERMLQYGGADLRGKRLYELNSAFAQALDDLKAGESRMVPLLGRRRGKSQRLQFLYLGFTRDFIFIGGVTAEV